MKYDIWPIQHLKILPNSRYNPDGLYVKKRNIQRICFILPSQQELQNNIIRVCENVAKNKIKKVYIFGEAKKDFKNDVIYCDIPFNDFVNVMKIDTLIIHHADKYSQITHQNIMKKIQWNTIKDLDTNNI